MTNLYLFLSNFWALRASLSRRRFSCSLKFELLYLLHSSILFRRCYDVYPSRRCYVYPSQVVVPFQHVDGRGDRSSRIHLSLSLALAHLVSFKILGATSPTRFLANLTGSYVLDRRPLTIERTQCLLQKESRVALPMVTENPIPHQFAPALLSIGEVTIEAPKARLQHETDAFGAQYILHELIL